MNAKEKHYDRRHSERKGNARRSCERLNCSFEILIPGHNGKTVNVSASGVYFEVFTKKREVFFPGTIIAVQINLLISTPGLEGSGIKITGSGFVVRNEIKDVTSRGNRLGVALKFDEKLNILVDYP